MDISIRSDCFRQQFNTDIIQRFQQSTPRDKDHVLDDVMSIWDLIKDLFNDFHHYQALSALFDLTQIERQMQRQVLSSAEQVRLLRGAEKLIEQLNTLILEPMYIQTAFYRKTDEYPSVSVCIADKLFIR